MNRGEIRHELVKEVELKGVSGKVRVFRVSLVEGDGEGSPARSAASFAPPRSVGNRLAQKEPPP